MNPAEVLGALAGVVVRVGALPHDLVDKVRRTEDRVEHELEVVAGSRVTVQIERPRWLEHPVELDQPDRHLHEVGHHLVLTDPGAQGGHDRADRSRHLAMVDRRIRQEGVVRLRTGSPVPRVVEGDDLGVTLPSRLVLEDDVVRSVRVEGRIEVDEVDRLVRDVTPEDIEIVAVVEDLRLHPGRAYSATGWRLDYVYLALDKRLR